MGDIDIKEEYNLNEENDGKQLFVEDEDEVEDLRFSADGTEFRMIINKGGVGGVPHYLDYDLVN